MSHLLRSQAPISEAGWSLLEQEARARLEPALGARRVVDVSGPHGWEHSASNLGRVRELPGAPAAGVVAQARVVMALVELRADFELSRAELRDADRGAPDADLAPLDEAARAMAVAENAAVFHGLAGAFAGLIERSPHEPVQLGEPDGHPGAVAVAVARLLDSGVGGPFALALGEDLYSLAVGAAEHGGYPLADHLRQILDGPLVRVPGLRGGAVLSRRGGDFLLETGEDLSIGYDSHDGEVVRLYIEESLSFRVATPEAAVALSA